MSKICFFDIDGTLSDERGGAQLIIPASCRNALKQARQKGVLLLANTGRPISTISHEIFDLNLDGYVLGCGTEIILRDQRIYYRGIDIKERQRLIQEIIRLSFCCVLEGSMGYAAINYENNPWVTKILENYRAEGYSEYDFGDKEYKFEKFCLFKLPNETWPPLSFLKGYTLIHRDDNFYEVIPEECSKGKAIDFLLDRLKINREDSYGFGDSENDLEMLKAVGNRIVMGHAPEIVQKQADYVTASASMDGIEQAMKFYHLIG